MITLLIGHRGTGKTALLNRIKKYLKSDNTDFIDLDMYIETEEGQTIDQLFTQGESYFRKLEKKHFLKITQQYTELKKDLYLVTGAGFHIDSLPKEVHVLWVTRPSDTKGRIFLNRPRLNQESTPIEEYLERYPERQNRYCELSDEVLTLTEGYLKENKPESQFFTNQIQNMNGALTLLPENFKRPSTWNYFISRRLSWGISLFELRDDILSEKQIQMALQSIPKEKILLSFRCSPASPLFLKLVQDQYQWDWALELGSPPDRSQNLPPTIVSAHEYQENENLQDFFKRLELNQSCSVLKAAPFIKSWSELLQGHQWHLSDPKRNVFLPRSEKGRWQWYRLWMKPHLLLNFFKEGSGSSEDQPYLLDWLRFDFQAKNFAAILGDPVTHSWTPAEQEGYFKEKNQPVLRISVQREESEAWRVLPQLGLTHAAVTSPLKTIAADISQNKSPEALRYQSVNTLYWNSQKQQWWGHNTDALGVQELLKKNPNVDTSIALWGGGGTLPLLQDHPNIKSYSARTGQLREASMDSRSSPEVLIWATPYFKNMKWPPSQWKPKTVIDLNYNEDSPGREYALKQQCPYLSGATMFYKQAEEQRKFWSQFDVS